ncbi:MAG: hypothetical protein ABIS20_22545, partial [Thermoanaerobaculia bacterium]
MAVGAASLELVSQVAPSQISGTGAGSTFGRNAVPLSDDGRYAVFLSSATNLVSGQRDANQAPDVFLQDLLTGTTTLVSHLLGSPVTAGNDGSDQAAISGDGRWVAYTSQAADLAPGQAAPPFSSNDRAILLYDRSTDASTLIAQRPVAFFHQPAISADGRYVVFASDARDLVPSLPSFAQFNVFLYDREARSVQLVSPDGGSLPGHPTLSADGRYVAFFSSTPDGSPAIFLFDRISRTVTLVGPGQDMVMSADGRYLAVHGFQSTYLYDRVTQAKTQLATANPGDTATPSPALAISPDGRYVALASLASRVIPPQPGGPSAAGIYLYDRLSATFTLASRKHGSATTPSSSAVSSPALSADGRFVAFLSRDPDLVTGQTDNNFDWDVFLFDRTSGTLTLVSRAGASATTAANRFSSPPAVSADGARVLFSSPADDLAAGVPDRNRGEDVFVYSTASATLAAVTRHASDLPSITPAGESLAAAVSGDGRWVAFESTAAHLVAGQSDANDNRDTFLYDRATRATILVSHAAGSPTRAAQGESFSPVITPDGRWVLFTSSATDLVAGTAFPGSGDVSFFLFDRLTGTNVLVGRTQTGLGISPFPEARITPDGRWVAFSSYVPNLIPGQQGPRTFNVFLWDRTTGGTTLVSHSTAGAAVTGNLQSYRPRISDDGRWIAFASEASNLVPGQVDANDEPDLFLWDRTTGKTVLVSHALGSPLAAGSVNSKDSEKAFSMSADGRSIAFQTSSFAPLEPGAERALYIYDRVSTALARIAPLGAEPAISADGRYVAFISFEVPIPGSAGESQVFLLDRGTQTTTLVSRSISGGHGGNDDVLNLAISADGRYVAFDSRATDLAPGQPPPTFSGPLPRRNVFLWDRLAGATAWVSAPTPESIQTSDSYLPVLSASGRQVAFNSGVDFVAGDLNGSSDVYLFSLDPPPPPTPSGPVTVPPCALFTGPLRSNARKVLKAAGACGVPAGAKQVAVKITVSQGTGKGNV